MFLSNHKAKISFLLAVAVVSSISAIGCGRKTLMSKKGSDASKPHLAQQGGAVTTATAPSVLPPKDPNASDFGYVLSTAEFTWTAVPGKNYVLYKCSLAADRQSYSCAPNLVFLLAGGGATNPATGQPVKVYDPNSCYSNESGGGCSIYDDRLAMDGEKVTFQGFEYSEEEAQNLDFVIWSY